MAAAIDNVTRIVPAAPAAPAGERVMRRGDRRSSHERTARWQRALRIVSPFLLIGAWELCAGIGFLDTRFFPAPSTIVLSGIAMGREGLLTEAVHDSMLRLVIGYATGALAGVLLGLWMGLSRWTRALLEPWLQLTYPVPKLAVYPLIVMVVGLGDAPINVLLAIAVFYIVCINTLAGVLTIKPAILDVSKDYGANFLQRAWTIALPGSLPHIFTGLEISLGIAYIVLVAAEFVGASTGLGNVIFQSWQLFDVSPMYVAIVLISLLGYGSTLGVRYIAGILMPWHRSK